MNFISVLLSLEHISDFLSKSICLSVGKPLETVVFHLLLVSVGDLSPAVELKPLHEIQLSFCGTRLNFPWTISTGIYMELSHQRHNQLPV
jgi:hypothetical protein